MTLDEYQELYPRKSGAARDVYEITTRRDWTEQECREISIHDHASIREVNDAIHQLAAMIRELLYI